MGVDGRCGAGSASGPANEQRMVGQGNRDTGNSASYGMGMGAADWGTGGGGGEYIIINPLKPNQEEGIIEI